MDFFQSTEHRAYIVSPLTLLLTFGYFRGKYGHLGNASSIEGIITAGILQAFAFLLLGCLLYSVSNRLKDLEITKKLKTFLVVVQSIGEISIVGIIVYVLHNGGRTPKDFTLVAMFSVLLLSLSFSSSLWSKILNNRFSIYLGKLSYAVYLNHFAVLILANKFFKSELDNMGYIGSTLIILGIVIAYSMITTKIVDVIECIIKRKIATNKIS